MNPIHSIALGATSGALQGLIINSIETAQKVNAAWEDFKNSRAFSKLSFYQKIWTSSFFNEMEKTAQYNS